jgi:hypothetical protein
MSRSTQGAATARDQTRRVSRLGAVGTSASAEVHLPAGRWAVTRCSPGKIVTAWLTVDPPSALRD